MGNSQSSHPRATSGGSPNTNSRHPKSASGHQKLLEGDGVNGGFGRDNIVPSRKSRRSKLELPDLASLSLGLPPPSSSPSISSNTALATSFIHPNQPQNSTSTKPIPIPGANQRRLSDHQIKTTEGEIGAQVPCHPNPIAPGERGKERERGRTRSREPRDLTASGTVSAAIGEGGIGARQSRDRDRDRSEHRHRRDQTRPIPSHRSPSISPSRPGHIPHITPLDPTLSTVSGSSYNTHQSQPQGRQPSTTLSYIPSYHPPLEPPEGPIEALSRYESKDGELRRKTTTGAERHRQARPFKQEVIQSQTPLGVRRVEMEKEKAMLKSERIKIPTKLSWKTAATQVYVTGSFTAVPWRQRTLLTPIVTSFPVSQSTSQPQSPSTPASNSTSSTSMTMSILGSPGATSAGGSQSGGPSTPPQPVPHSHSRSHSRHPTAAAIHEVTIPLSPGTHHVKFIVDDVYMCSDELQTATDNDGNLVNVLQVQGEKNIDLNDLQVGEEDGKQGTPSIAIHNLSGPEAASGSREIVVSPPISDRSVLTSHLNQPDQFWSSDEEYTDSSTTSTTSAKKRPKKTSTWTTTPPEELGVAVSLEESFLANPTSPAHSRILQVIPPAPHLPRFLDKLILNVKEGHEKSRHTYHASSTGSSSPSTLAAAHAHARGSPTSAAASRRAGTKGHAPSPTPIPAYIATNTPLPLAVAPRLGQGAINTSEQSAGAGDDKSVLPIPSHVVLNHLGTSAIRGGVLAASTTVRYRQKYVTTVYYKPTS